jgi:hypothetical protein
LKALKILGLGVTLLLIEQNRKCEVINIFILSWKIFLSSFIIDRNLKSESFMLHF